MTWSHDAATWDGYFALLTPSLFDFLSSSLGEEVCWSLRYRTRLVTGPLRSKENRNLLWAERDIRKSACIDHAEPVGTFDSEEDPELPIEAEMTTSYQNSHT